MPCGVLVPLLVSEGGVIEVLYTRRTSHLNHHPGEISFPGGGKEEGDADLEATALREAEEELGIVRDAVEILGRLDDFHTIPGRHMLRPFVGRIDAGVELCPDPFEVERLLRVPFADLLAPEKFEVRDFDAPAGARIEVPFYHWRGEVIWGATGRITRQLVRIVDWGAQGGRTPP